VSVLVEHCSEVALQDVQTGDIWINESETHAGLVIGVMPALRRHEVPEITIQHDSSRQGGVATNDFERYFRGRGSFWR
jgi:hypothetical protein